MPCAQKPQLLRFPKASLVITPRALENLDFDEVFIALSRHLEDEPGPEESEREYRAIGPVISRVRSRKGPPFVIITDPEANTTTVLLPK